MTRHTDVIVVGLGAMGSAALHHLAQRGAHAIGFDRFAPPHTLGSTHGLSRIIREAYYEHPRYVPLVQRAYELWADLEQRAERRLFRQTGGLMIGRSDGVLVAGARRSAKEHALQCEELTPRAVRSRFPAFALGDDMVALFEPRAGVLDPEKCVDAHLTLAASGGAELHANEPVVTWHVRKGRVHVQTPVAQYQADRLALCAGAWTPALLGTDQIPLTVERQVMHWFIPARDAHLFGPERYPIAMIEYAPERFFYTLPDTGEGVKAAIHHEGAIVDPEAVHRDVDATDVEPVQRVLRRFIPAAAGTHRRAATCLYTNTPDGHFLISPHAHHEEALIVSACSGHGFKFASAIGEAIADLLTGVPRPDLEPFTRGRLTYLA